MTDANDALCPTCHGTGQCPWCAGAGMLVAPDASDPSNRQPCSHCAAPGDVARGTPGNGQCASCGGSGIRG